METGTGTRISQQLVNNSHRFNIGCIDEVTEPEKFESAATLFLTAGGDIFTDVMSKTTLTPP